ncbi:hypothetical protein ACFLTS_02545 [Chloroflexota bacterium]
MRNRKWSDEEFLNMRRKVLSWWPTGKELEYLNEAVEYRRRLPVERIGKIPKKEGTPFLGSSWGILQLRKRWST